MMAAVTGAGMPPGPAEPGELHGPDLPDPSTSGPGRLTGSQKT
jgi:hypothetical protein